MKRRSAFSRASGRSSDLEAPGQVLRELVREPLPHRARLEQPGQQRRVPAEGVGQELARPAQARQQRDGAGMPAQQAEEGGVLALGAQALQVVQRHVRIGRGGQLGEQAGQRGREQLGLARRGRQRVQVAERGGRIREAQHFEPPERSAIVRRRGQQVLHALSADWGSAGAISGPPHMESLKK